MARHGTFNSALGSHLPKLTGGNPMLDPDWISQRETCPEPSLGPPDSKTGCSAASLYTNDLPYSPEPCSPENAKHGVPPKASEFEFVFNNGGPHFMWDKAACPAGTATPQQPRQNTVMLSIYLSLSLYTYIYILHICIYIHTYTYTTAYIYIYICIH